MYSSNKDFTKNLVASIALLLFSIILTFIISRFSKKYRIENQDPLTLKKDPLVLKRKWREWRAFMDYKILPNRNLLISVAFAVSIHYLMIHAVSYFRFSYNHMLLIIADIACCILSVLIALTFMFRDVKVRSVKMFNKLPAALRITAFILSFAISQIIHSNNVNFVY